MREDIEQRARDLALYIVENNATVRDAARGGNTGAFDPMPGAEGPRPVFP